MFTGDRRAPAGDVLPAVDGANLQRLLGPPGLSSEPPQEPNADVLSLLRDIPWTTVTVERAHGSMAVLHKYHGNVGEDGYTQQLVTHTPHT